MGFGVKWISSIKWCISTVSFFVLINGSPTGFFKSSKDLRQGDPLSLYLFVIGMEVFSTLVDKVASGGFLSGYNITNRRGEAMQITHLLFANDTLVFCRDSQDQMAYLSRILLWFEVVTELRINLEKSSILPVGNVENLDDLAYELGYKTGTLPSTNLGLPLGMKHNSLQVWDGVEERFRKKLALWKNQYISKGDWLNLIKSTLTNLPIYTMSLFKIPKGVKRRLEKIQRDFLLGGDNLDKKIHLINWGTVCSNKEKGDLGIRRLTKLNQSLLGKWNWRLTMEEKTPLEKANQGKIWSRRRGLVFERAKGELCGGHVEGN